MKKLAIILLVILSGCSARPPEIAGATCGSKCKIIGAYKYKVNPNEFSYCECYVRLKEAEDE